MATDQKPIALYGLLVVVDPTVDKKAAADHIRSLIKHLDGIKDIVLLEESSAKSEAEWEARAVKNRMVAEADVIVHVQHSCACESSFSCGDRRNACGLGTDLCIKQHFIHHCTHDFTGPEVQDYDGRGSSVTCKACGMTAMAHDIAVGP